jgi:hypothetical protein
MTRKLEEFFNLPAMNLPEIDDEDLEEIAEYTTEAMNHIMARADKIDAALPQVSGLDNVDVDYDNYATKAIDAFDDLIELGKNVEDRFAADIFNAASSMIGNAITAKTNKAQKKLEMVKLQISKAKLEHEKEKLEYLKKRHLNAGDDTETQESEGHVLSTRNDILQEIIAGIKKSNDS